MASHLLGRNGLELAEQAGGVVAQRLIQHRIHHAFLLHVVLLQKDEEGLRYPEVNCRVFRVDCRAHLREHSAHLLVLHAHRFGRSTRHAGSFLERRKQQVFLEPDMAFYLAKEHSASARKTEPIRCRGHILGTRKGIVTVLVIPVHVVADESHGTSYARFNRPSLSFAVAQNVASGNASSLRTISGQSLANSALSATYCCISTGTSASA